MKIEIIRSKRKTISIQPVGDRVILRGPMNLTDREAEALIEKHKSWIQKHSQPPVEKFTPQQLRELKDQAADQLPPKVSALAKTLGVTYDRISIRAQHTRWGSCSAAGNLSFNCLLMLVPEQVQRYVIIHELCHRIHLDHSRAFWALVAAYDPNWRRHRSWLKADGSALIHRLP